eukprot:GFYU01005976.1.p1 GENE.GFYU01005976.1~~GFYU01005976.1.p1  ORF type:complete len:267 (+),score=118.25 GFYU01005976.1:60-803(+)
MGDELIEKFTKIGIDQKKAKDTLKNKSLTATLSLVIDEAKLPDGACEKALGNLLYNIAACAEPPVDELRKMLSEYVGAKKINRQAQLDVALPFLNALGESKVDVAKFEEACGVGVEVSADQVTAAVKAYVDSVKEKMVAERYRYNVGEALRSLREKPELKWAEGSMVKKELDAQMLALLGPKTEADMAKPDKKKKEKNPAAKKATKAAKKPAAKKPAAKKVTKKVAAKKPAAKKATKKVAAKKVSKK